MALTQVTTSGLANGAVTSSKINASVQLGGPTITQIQITDSSYNVLDDTAVSTSGGYIKITGTGFAAGAIVVIGSTNATSTGFVSSTVLNVQVPALSAGTYTVYVVNSNGGTAIGVNGLTYSALPSWVTGSTLPNGTSGSAISIQLSATDATSYVLQAGSTLPTGLTLSGGGLLSGTVTVGVETVYAFTVVAIDAQAQDSPRAFTITIIVGDPYFYLTTLLLPGNGTNNGTNNTFLDSSTNNFTVTRYSNTTQGTFTPFSQTGWSNYFDGSGDYLTFPTNTAFSFGTGDFTISLWCYTGVDSLSPGGYSRSLFTIGNITGYLRINQYHGGTTGAFRAYVGGVNVCDGSTVKLSDNAWHNITIVRESGNVRHWIDGVYVGTVAYSTSITNTITNGIGADMQGPDGNWNGYISSVYVNKGTALYTGTSNITVPSAPLTVVANTSLATCQSNGFKDNSTNNFTITRNGDTSVQSFSPFAPNAGYTTATIGGSAYFDGTGDLLRAPNNAAFDFGTQNLTFEAWVYPTAYNGVYNGIITQDQNNGQAGSSVSLGMSSSGQAQWFAAPSSGAYAVSITGSVVPLNAWTHLAGVRSGNVWTLYMNGVSIGTATSSVTITQGSAPYGGISVNGLNGYGLYYFPGYISGARVVNGSAVYSSNFTPPTSPPTAIANTALLLNFTNGQITDATSKNILETVGDAKISTAQSKWGGSSIYLDGTGDWLPINAGSNNLLNVGSNNFTIEAWVYTTSTGQQCIIGSNANADGSGSYMFNLNYNSNKLRFYCRYGGGSTLDYQADAGTFPTNAWTHVAVTRNGSSLRMFINGTQVGTTSTTLGTSAIDNSSSNYNVGRTTDSALPFTGYINDLRTTRGYARYTGNFTPPTSAFPTL